MHANINYQLMMLCPRNFEETIEKGILIERALIARGVIKLYIPKDQPCTSNEKPKIWAKNKNVTNDGVVDAKVVHNVQTPNVPQSCSNSTAMLCFK